MTVTAVHQYRLGYCHKKSVVKPHYGVIEPAETRADIYKAAVSAQSAVC